MQAESREQVRSGQAIPGQARPSQEGDEGSSSIYYCYATCSHHDTIPADTVEHTVRDQGVLRACKKTHPFFSAFSLPAWVCLSRACLGKSIVLSIYKNGAAKAFMLSCLLGSQPQSDAATSPLQTATPCRSLRKISGETCEKTRITF